ncbi:MAG: transcription initiation factor IIB [Promethearchaeota archaeon]
MTPPPYGSCFDDFDDDKTNICCGTPSVFITDDGFRVCRNCGMVYGTEYVSTERRAYTADEVRARRRTEPRWRLYGPRTVIGLTSMDSKGRQLASRRAQLFNRLSKIQGSLINSIERNFWESRPKLSALCQKLQIPDFIQESAWKIYSDVAKQKLTMGRSIESFVTASLYAAIRIHDFPRLLEEIVEVAMIPLRSVHRSLGLIVRMVLPKMHLRYHPISPNPLIYRFGAELDLSITTQKFAYDLLKSASKRGLRKMGKDPKGIAAAVLYLAAKQKGERKTQTQIASVARITEVTLRTRAKQIRGHLIRVERA